MHPFLRRLSLVLAAVLFVAAGSSAAAEFPLTVELEDGRTAEFGTVFVTERGGGLAFEITLNPLVLGLDADLDQLYFNLGRTLTGLKVRTDEAGPATHALIPSPRVVGGAGSKFDFGVRFGPVAEGSRQTAAFRVIADQALSVSDLAPRSSTAGGIVANVAAHVRDTSFLEGVTSATVAGSWAATPRSARARPPRPARRAR